MSYRKITVNGVLYHWKHGRSYTQIKRDGKRVSLIANSKLLDMTENDYERACHKRYAHVTPGDIEKEIKRVTGQ